MKTKSYFIILGLIAICACASTEGEKGDKTNVKLLDRKGFELLFGQLDSIGFYGNIAVIHKHDTLIRSFGFLDKTDGIRTNRMTIYDIGSVTKQFTAAAILKLVSNQKLYLSDYIAHYFEDVPEKYADVTIHHLLTHTSGMPTAIGRDEEQISKKEYLKRLWKSEKAKNDGLNYMYSNVGYSLLAMIIEKVSSKSYEQFLIDELLEPSGMTQTGYLLPKYDDHKIAIGYNESGELGKPYQQNWTSDGPSWHLKGNGGLLSTVDDMLKWHHSLENFTVLSPEITALLYEKHIPEDEFESSFYGYGWALFPTPRNTTLVTHNGGNGYFFCDFLRYRKEELTILIFTNFAKPAYEQLGFQIARIVFDKKYIPQLITGNRSESLLVEDHPNGRMMENLVNVLFERSEEAIEQCVKNHFHQNLKEVAAMKQHVKMLKQIGEEIDSNQIENIHEEGEETFISFKDIDLKLMIIFQDNQIVGLGID